MEHNGNSHFLMAIGRHDGGSLIEVADEQLSEVIRSVHMTGKKGAVTLTLGVEPNGDNGYQITCKVAAKKPVPDFGSAFYYVDANGDLTRKTPASEARGLMDRFSADEAKP